MSFVKMFNIDGFYVTCMYKVCVFVKILYSEIYLISVTIGDKRRWKIIPIRTSVSYII